MIQFYYFLHFKNPYYLSALKTSQRCSPLDYLHCLHNCYVSGCSETLLLFDEVSKVDEALESCWILQNPDTTQRKNISLEQAAVI